jgi:peptide/nickel transport system substrate-binding protein
MGIDSRRTRLATLSAAALAIGLIGGCGSSNSGSGSSDASGGPSGVLTVNTGATGSFVDDFNPFSPSVEAPANGMIYEPLFYFDTVKAGEVDPWLGTKYSWTSGGRVLSVQLRKGVTWSDGKAFTSADVAFTFNLELKNKALNTYGLPLKSVATNGPTAVTLTFTKPAYQDVYYALGKVDMLPQHIWASQADPTKWQDPKPVGTGAFTLVKASGQDMELQANPHYYLPGMPKFKTLRFLSFSGNSSSNASIESGNVDWAGNFIPNIATTYLKKSKDFHLVDIPLATAFLVTNDQQGPTADVKVRQAMSDALNRSFISKTVYNGFAPPVGPDALLTPNFANVQDPAQANAHLAFDPAKAKSLLQSDGYTMGSNGIFTKGGQPLSITLQTISGYTDYVSIAQIVQQEFKAVGIELKVQGESNAAFTSAQDSGNFNMIIAGYGFSPSPFAYYDELLDSKIAPPIGQTDTVGNFGRYSNPAVDALLQKISGTNSVAAQQPSFAKIEQTFVSEVPSIPLFEAQNEIEFNGAHVGGFPTKQNPYASPAVYMQPDIGWVAMHLGPAH